MAIYRNIQMSFWTDPLVVEEFTSEERLMYLYLLTNPHTNLCGCYPISVRQMSFETGLDIDSVNKNLSLLESHDCIKYDKETREILICKWFKYNWTSSEKFRKPLLAEIMEVKSNEFKEYLISRYNDDEDTLFDNESSDSDTVSVQYVDSIDTTVTVTDTDTVSDTVSNKKKTKPVKDSYGEYQNVKLTSEEYSRLIADYGDEDTQEAIRYLDEYIEEKHKKYNSCYLTMRRWVYNAVYERKKTTSKSNRKTYSELAMEMGEEWI